MKYILILIYLFCINNLIHAEGPPFTLSGKPDCEGCGMALTQSQKNELNSSRVIHLTKEQMKQHHFKPFDSLLYIITTNFRDCTCQLKYGMWFHPDSININKFTEYDEYDSLAAIKKVPPTRSMFSCMNEKSIENKSQSIYINVKGDIFYMDKKIELNDSTMYYVVTMIDSVSLYYYSLDTNNHVSEDEYPFVKFNLYIPPLFENLDRENVLNSLYMLTALYNNEEKNKFFYR